MYREKPGTFVSAIGTTREEREMEGRETTLWGGEVLLVGEDTIGSIGESHRHMSYLDSEKKVDKAALLRYYQHLGGVASFAVLLTGRRATLSHHRER